MIGPHRRTRTAARLLTAVATAFVLGVILLWMVPAALAAAGDATYTFSARGAPIDGLDWGRRICADGSGNVTLGGDCSLDAFTTAMYVYHLSSTGVPEWGGPWAGSSASSFYDVAVDGSGNVYSAGAEVDPGGGTNYLVAGWQPDGTPLWAHTYDGPKYNDEALAVTTGADGSVYVTGMSQGSDMDMDIVTVKYDTAGTRRWVRRYNGPWDRHDRGLAIAVRGTSVFVAGISARTTRAGRDWDTVVLRYTTGGVRKWARLYDDSAGGYEWVTGIAVTGRAVYVCGYGKGDVSAASSNALLLKYGYSGRRLWAKWVAGVFGGRDAWDDIAIAPGGFVNVTGYVQRAGTGLDAATASYRSDGRRRWLRYVASAGAGNDVGEGVAVADDGTTYVGGYGQGSSATADVLAVSYAADGTPQWTTFWDSGAGADIGHDVAITNGRAWVVGSQASFGFGDDIIVVGFER